MRNFWMRRWEKRPFEAITPENGTIDGWGRRPYKPLDPSSGMIRSRHAKARQAAQIAIEDRYQLPVMRMPVVAKPIVA